MELINIVYLMILGGIGCLLFSFLRLPVPALLGGFTIVTVIRVLNIIDLPEPHPRFFDVLQIILGFCIGSQITKDVYTQLLKLVYPAGLMALWALTVTFSVGFLLSIITKMDTITALLSASPGGLAEMNVIALSTGADAVTVSFLQLSRLLLTLLFFPVMVKRSISQDTKTRLNKIWEHAYTFVSEKISFTYYQAIGKNILKLCSFNVITLLSIASIGGTIGIALSLPAGGMLGAFLASAALSIRGLKIEVSLAVPRSLMQIGIGVLIGFNFSRDTLSTFRDILFPVIIFSVLILLSSLLMAKLLERITGWERAVCMLASAPAGFTAMTVLAYELEARPLEVSMLHLSRLMVIKCVVPFMIVLFI